MNYVTIAYLIYLPITVFLTVWVAHTLFKNGRVFLVDIFHGNADLADSVNKLLVVGFYLINIGWAVFALKTASNISGWQEVVEVLSIKVGTIILVLGGMHFFNLYVFFKLRNRAKMQHSERY